MAIKTRAPRSASEGRPEAVSLLTAALAIAAPIGGTSGPDTLTGTDGRDGASVHAPATTPLTPRPGRTE